MQFSKEAPCIADVFGHVEAISNLLYQISTFTSGNDPGKDVRMPKTIAVVKLPEILGSGSSHLVKLAGKIDSFSLVLWRTPEGGLKRSIEVQFHSMVFAARKEVRKYCPKYGYFEGEGILDFSTDCASGQFEPGDLGKPPQPKRGRLCESCCFFAGNPEEQIPEATVSAAPGSDLNVCWLGKQRAAVGATAP